MCIFRRRSQVIIGTFLLTGIFSLIYRQQLQASNIPDTPEIREVIAALEHAEQVLGVPIEQLDLKQLSEVLMNHPDYVKQMASDEVTELRRYTNKIRV